MPFTSLERYSFLGTDIPRLVQVPLNAAQCTFRDLWVCTRLDLARDHAAIQALIADPGFWKDWKPETWVRSPLQYPRLHWYDRVLPWLLAAFDSDEQTLEEVLVERDPALLLACEPFRKKCLRGRPKSERYSETLRGEVIFRS